ncbi:hypothetical protein BC792_1138 [Sphingobacterium allocomposti]|jgi:hypothetical protein|uniref:Lumazine-binding protein n=1 Tax=Sphingobacterium allocomposti TaxID=415956 RepID=A0A5S5DDN1_9SPHI|nr:hypothetical protein [Sphingobacterium composti Yoo et al. 2007 non Ten et al. 2007]TYP94140.1 hypothetical protein BC792_1138 [Sphingobacterium composti Yoo et al. 2007 non Ten et al. 2007]HLS97074.1 hypothetical protein [Sphingobacterium sp.]
MKRVLTTLAATLILITSFSSMAAEKMDPLKDYSSVNIVNAYLEATTLGSVDMNKFLFAEDFEYHNTASNLRYGKKAYTNFLKQHKGIKFNCETTYEILDESGEACIAKAIMKFSHFTRVDYITLNHSKEGWKVSKVVTTYPPRV